MDNSLNKRIWELDFARGVAILCVIAVHFTYDLVYFANLPIEFPEWFIIVKQYGGIFFILLSGVCATLGSKSVKRGAFVFAFGLVITAVTLSMHYLFDFDKSILIQWGILHLLGFCMMSYPLYKKAPLWLTFIIGLIIIVLGPVFKHTFITGDWLCPLGIRGYSFESSDYFPIFPHMGYFMIGTVIGKLVYKEKKTLFPKVNAENPFIRFFSWCGRKSLWIYLLHQPICYVIVTYLF